jgi:hypothetical protein
VNDARRRQTEVSNGDDPEDGCLLGREIVQFGIQQTTGFISKMTIIFFPPKKSLFMLKQNVRALKRHTI